MNCEEIRDLLPKHRSGTIDDATASAIRSHLEGCETCRGIARDEEAIRSAFRSTRPDVTPLDMGLLYHAARARRRRFHRVMRAAAAVAVIALCLGLTRFEVRVGSEGWHLAFSLRGMSREPPGDKGWDQLDRSIQDRIDGTIARTLARYDAFHRSELKDLAVMVRDVLMDEYRSGMSGLFRYIQYFENQTGEEILRNRQALRRLGGIVLTGDYPREPLLEEGRQ